MDVLPPLDLTGCPPAPAVKVRRRVNSKRKGSGMENRVAKVLTAALAPMQFRRSQSSGAVLGGKNVKLADSFSTEARTLFVGDVVPTNEADVGKKFKFVVECKFYKTPPNIEHLFVGDQIKNWFLKGLIDAKKLNKELVLIIKYNHTSIFSVIDEQLTPLPTTISKKIKIDELTIFKFDEALKDTDWWISTRT